MTGQFLLTRTWKTTWQETPVRSAKSIVLQSLPSCPISPTVTRWQAVTYMAWEVTNASTTRTVILTVTKRSEGSKKRQVLDSLVTGTMVNRTAEVLIRPLRWVEPLIEVTYVSLLSFANGTWKKTRVPDSGWKAPSSLNSLYLGRYYQFFFSRVGQQKASKHCEVRLFHCKSLYSS